MPWFSYRGKPKASPRDWDANPTSAALSSPSHARLESLYAWERRTRGYELYPTPVALEPAFVPLDPDVEAGAWQTVPQPKAAPAPQAHLSLLLPPEQMVSPAQMGAWLTALRGVRHPLSLEVVADGETIRYQISGAEGEIEAMAAALALHFPEAKIALSDDAILETLVPLTESEAGYQVVDFGLYEGVYRPLRLFENFHSDPYAALIGVLGALESGEMAGVQLLLAPTSREWGAALQEFVAQFSGVTQAAHPGTSDTELQRSLRYKLATPLWAASLRVFAVTHNGPRQELRARALDHCQRLGTALSFVAERSSSGTLSNELLALDDEGYDLQGHLRDVLDRASRRSGMLLSQHEIAGLWHPPAPSLSHPRLLRFDPKRRDLPDYLRDAAGATLGLLDVGAASSRSEPVVVPWPDSFRPRHAYLLGATRMGKSTLMLNLITQDMLAGRGLCLIDPHGDLAQDVLRRIPPQRQKDVLFLDLSDTAFPPALGLLEASEEWEKRLLLSDLLSILHRVFASSWGDRLEHILRHALLTLLADESEPHSLRDIRALLSDEAYREQLLSRITDPDLHTFWRSEFGGYSSSAFAPVYNKLGLLLSSPVVRNIVAGTQSRLHPGELMQGRKILIVNLAQSLIGEDNAHFLGALLVSKIQLAAMHNLRRGKEERMPFTLYVDEFQNFVVSSFDKILSEAGKAGLTLVMANQFLEQLGDGLQTAILSNVGTLLSFRVSADSGRKLQGEFGGFFGAKELTDLERGQAVVRLGRAGDSFLLRTFPPVKPEAVGADSSAVDEILETTRATVCRPRREVEAELREAEARLQQQREAWQEQREAAKARAKEQEKEEKAGVKKAASTKSPAPKAQPPKAGTQNAVPNPPRAATRPQTDDEDAALDDDTGDDALDDKAGDPQNGARPLPRRPQPQQPPSRVRSSSRLANSRRVRKTAPAAPRQVPSAPRPPAAVPTVDVEPPVENDTAAGPAASTKSRAPHPVSLADSAMVDAFPLPPDANDQPPQATAESPQGTAQPKAAAPLFFGLPDPASSGAKDDEAREDPAQEAPSGSAVKPQSEVKMPDQAIAPSAVQSAVETKSE